MSKSEGLERVLREEERAWKIAAGIGAVAERHDLGALAEELVAFREFLLGEFETHLAKEESDLFPHLAERGLAIEVREAKRQHEELRRLRDELVLANLDEANEMRAVLREIGEELMHHLRYEADFLYVDLTQVEAAIFRAHVDAASLPPVSKR